MSGILVKIVFICSFLVRSLSAAGFICHMESPMIIWAGCAAARGDFILECFRCLMLGLMERNKKLSEYLSCLFASRTLVSFWFNKTKADHPQYFPR